MKGSLIDVTVGAPLTMDQTREAIRQKDEFWLMVSTLEGYCCMQCGMATHICKCPIVTDGTAS